MLRAEQQKRIDAGRDLTTGQSLSNTFSFRDPAMKVVRGGSILFHPGQVPGELTHMKSVRGRGGRNSLSSPMSSEAMTPEQHHPFNGESDNPRNSTGSTGGGGLLSRFLGSAKS